jgi:Barstar (barnase inhibitor)
MSRPESPATEPVAAGVRPATAVQARAAARAVTLAGGVVRSLHGSAMTTEDAAFDEFARALEFPDYFGRNWDAVWDCLTDLDWLPAPAYLLVVENADRVLGGAPLHWREVWRRGLDRVVARWAEPVTEGAPWDRPAVPFTVLLVG